MKTAVCYYSRHHENTLKVLRAMAQVRDLDLIDVTAQKDIDLTGYDAVGFASGIYYGKYHQSVRDIAQRCLPEGKAVFFVYTCGSAGKGSVGELARIAASKGCKVLGEFGCRGYDTYGPFRLIGGIAKGRPNEEDLRKAQAFIASICGG